MKRSSMMSKARRFKPFGALLLAALSVGAILLPSTALASEAPTISVAGAPIWGTGEGSTIMRDPLVQAWSCKSSKSTAAFNAGSKSSGTLNLTLEGCNMGGWIGACNSSGKPSGTIVTSTLTFKLVYLDAAHTAWGILLSPPASGVFTEFSCGGGITKVTWTGSILGQITKPALNVETWSGTLVFQAKETGQQYEQINGTGTAYHLTDINTTLGSTQEVPTSVELTSNLKFISAVKFLP